MHNTFGWRNYQFTDTWCGTPDGEKLWYDLGGLFNVCSAEVVETTKEFERKKKKKWGREEITKDVIKRCYVKIGYTTDTTGRTHYEIVEIRPEEQADAEAVCQTIRQKVAEKNRRAMGLPE